MPNAIKLDSNMNFAKGHVEHILISHYNQDTHMKYTLSMQTTIKTGITKYILRCRDTHDDRYPLEEYEANNLTSAMMMWNARCTANG